MDQSPISRASNACGRRAPLTHYAPHNPAPRPEAKRTRTPSGGGYSTPATVPEVRYASLESPRPPDSAPGAAFPLMVREGERRRRVSIWSAPRRTASTYWIPEGLPTPEKDEPTYAGRGIERAGRDPRRRGRSTGRRSSSCASKGRARTPSTRYRSGCAAGFYSGRAAGKIGLGAWCLPVLRAYMKRPLGRVESMRGVIRKGGALRFIRTLHVPSRSAFPSDPAPWLVPCHGPARGFRVSFRRRRSQRLLDGPWPEDPRVCQGSSDHRTTLLQPASVSRAGWLSIVRISI